MHVRLDLKDAERLRAWSKQSKVPMSAAMRGWVLEGMARDVAQEETE